MWGKFQKSDNSKSWIYEKEINNAIRAFAKIQGNSKYYFG